LIIQNYGSKNEKKTCEIYYKASVHNHTDFQLLESKMVISHKQPFIGASLDGILSCSCCDKGVSAFIANKTHIRDAASQDSRLCLKEVEESLYLEHSHAYYY